MLKRIITKSLPIVFTLLFITNIYSYTVTITNKENCNMKIDVQSTETVDSLKEKVKKIYRLNENISLKYNGEQLDGFKKLDTYKIYNGSVIELVSSYTGHNYTEFVEETKPSCDKVGRKVRVCNICGKKDICETPKLSHDFGEYTLTVIATCQRNGIKQRVCKRCGHVEQENMPKLKHRYTPWKVTKEPTCEKEGNMERVCTYCHRKDFAKVGKLNHDLAEEEIEPTCTTKGIKMVKCSRQGCQYIESKIEIPAIGHKMSEWKVEENPTLVEKGKQERVCLNPGCKHKEEKGIASISQGGDQTMFVNSAVEKVANMEGTSKAAIVAFAMLIPVAYVVIKDIYISSKEKIKERKNKKEE